MEWQLPQAERTYLRELAKRQAEYAALPIMAARKQMWYDLNDGRPGARPPVIVETWTFDRDFMPDELFQCSSEVGRAIERQLLRNVRNHELIDDDKVIPDSFEMRWFVDIDELGLKVERETLKEPPIMIFVVIFGGGIGTALLIQKRKERRGIEID